MGLEQFRIFEIPDKIYVTGLFGMDEKNACNNYCTAHALLSCDELLRSRIKGVLKYDY